MKKYILLLFLFACRSSDIHIRVRNETLIKNGVKNNHSNMYLYICGKYKILEDSYEFIKSINDSVTTKVVNRYYVYKKGSRKLIIVNNENGLKVWKTNFNATESEMSFFTQNMALFHYHPISDLEFYKLIKPFHCDSISIQVDKFKTKKVFENFKNMDEMRVKISKIEIVVSNNFTDVEPFYNKKVLKAYRRLHDEYLTEYNVFTSNELDNRTNGISTSMNVKTPAKSDSALLEKLIYLYKHPSQKSVKKR